MNNPDEPITVTLTAAQWDAITTAIGFALNDGMGHEELLKQADEAIDAALTRGGEAAPEEEA